jgi:hypothetical protein
MRELGNHLSSNHEVDGEPDRQLEEVWVPT